MEIRYTYAHALFGGFGGILIANYFAAPWWGYALAAPAFATLSYVLALRQLRRRELKPTTLFVDYIAYVKKLWLDDRNRLR